MGRTKLLGMAILLLILFLAGAERPASAQQVILKMGTLAPEGTA
jgi:hypothetical protein